MTADRKPGMNTSPEEAQEESLEAAAGGGFFNSSFPKLVEFAEHPGIERTAIEGIDRTAVHSAEAAGAVARGGGSTGKTALKGIGAIVAGGGIAKGIDESTSGVEDKVKNHLDNH